MSLDEQAMQETEHDWFEPCACHQEKPVWGLVSHLLVFALLAFCLWAICLTPIAKGDQEVSVKPGRLKKIESKLDSKKLVWRALGDCDLIEDSSGKFATTLFPTPGTFQILVVGAKADEPLTELITITVEGVVPVPPGPGPNPPQPTDELAKQIGTAWQMEFASDKMQSVKALAGVYRYGAQAVVGSPDWGTLFDRMGSQAIATGAADKILNVQRAIQNELNAKIPRQRTAKIDDAGKTLATTTFGRIATILEGLQ